MNLYEFVKLATSIWSNDQKPYYFISQKLQEYQLDKVVYIESFNKRNFRVCYKIEYTDNNRKIYHYMYIPKENKVDFQLKPPVKSMFSNIPGPYKNI